MNQCALDLEVIVNIHVLPAQLGKYFVCLEISLGLFYFAFECYN